MQTMQTGRLSFNRILRISSKILQAKLLRRYLPLTVSWEITHRCNQDCLYCGIARYPKPELSTKAAIDVIDRLALLGTERISFTGGEPLMREDIGYIMNYTREKGILPTLNTNGILLKKLIGSLSSVSRITISLDGPDQVYRELRQSDSCHKTIESIKLCKSKGIPVVLTMVLSQRNLNEVEFVLGLAGQFGIKVIFQPASLYLLGTTQNNPVAPDPLLYREALFSIIEKKMSKEKYIYNSLAGLRHLLKWPGPADIPCWAGKLHCSIDTEGRVYPCGHTMRIIDEPISHYTALKGRNDFQRLAGFNCKQCWCASMVEFNLALALKPGVLWNMAKAEI